MPHKLILTADDYGMCEAVNRAIEDCVAAGTIGATCVMANMPSHESAAELRRRFPDLSLGIHWNVTQGRPVLAPEGISTLVRTDGSFYPPSEFKKLWWTRKIAWADIQAELCAQFQQLKALVGPIDFWNTHQDSHVFPGLFQSFVRLAKRLGIPAMRSHRRITVPKDSGCFRYYLTRPAHWFKGQLTSWWMSRAARSGMIMPGGKIHAPGYDATTQAIQELLGRIPWDTIEQPVEMVVHPARSVDEALFGRLTTSRLLEYRTFGDSSLPILFSSNGVQLVNFKELRFRT